MIFMDRPSTFSKRLNQLLDIFNISRSELARKTSVSKSSITHYLKGDWEAKQDKVYAIAKAMNVSEAWLMGYNVPMERDIKKISVSDVSETDIRLNKIIDQYYCLNSDGQIELEKYSDYLSTKQEYESTEYLAVARNGQRIRANRIDNLDDLLPPSDEDPTNI